MATPVGLDRRLASKYKATLAGRVLKLEDLANEETHPAVVIAPAELAADLSFTVFGPEPTLRIFSELADQVSRRR